MVIFAWGKKMPVKRLRIFAAVLQVELEIKIKARKSTLAVFQHELLSISQVTGGSHFQDPALCATQCDSLNQTHFYSY